MADNVPVRATTTEVVRPDDPVDFELPQLLVGHETPALASRLGNFYEQIPDMLERWIARSDSHHTRRNYRKDIETFFEFIGIRWPDDSSDLFKVSVGDVQAWRESMIEREYAPGTYYRRICSVSSFYRFMAEAAAHMKLPVNLPNPAHSQFIPRTARDPVEETEALSLAQARKLRDLPGSEDVVALRDRAILNFYLYTGARIHTGCMVGVSDFRYDEEDNTTIRIIHKGKKRRTVGLNYQAAESIREYVERAEITRGPLFRATKRGGSRELTDAAIPTRTMYDVINRYLLLAFPKKVKEVEIVDETGVVNVLKQSIYSPHSLRATTATLLLDAGEDIMAVKELLGHSHVTTTQVYDKRRRGKKDSASHNVPI